MKVSDMSPLLARRLWEISSNSPRHTAAKIPMPIYKTNLNKAGARSISYQCKGG